MISLLLPALLGLAQAQVLEPTEQLTQQSFQWSGVEAPFMLLSAGGGGALSTVFLYPALSSGPRISTLPDGGDDAATVVHDTWNGTQLVDSAGNTWTQNGTVPQVTGETASTMFAGGFAAAPTAGAGPFTDSKYYTLPASGPLQFPGGVFTVCVIYSVSTTSAEQLLVDQLASSAGWYMEVNGSGYADIGVHSASGGVSVGLVQVQPNAINISCGGRDALGTILMQTNMQPYEVSNGFAWSAPSSSTANIGNLSYATGYYTQGTIYEVWASTDSPSPYLFASIEQRFLNEVAATGQSLSDTLTTGATYYAAGKRWPSPASTPRVEVFTDGGGALLVEPEASTNELVNSESPATQTTGSLGAGSYTGSMLGSGSLAFAAGTATATGLPCTAHTYLSGDSNTCHFTITSPGTITATISGTVTHEQLEPLAARSTDMVSGASVVSPTRSAETVSFFNPAALQGRSWCLGATVAPYSGTWTTLGGSAISAGTSHAGANTAEVNVNTSLADLGQVYDNSAALKQASYTLGDSNPHKLLVCNSGGSIQQYVDGLPVSSTVSGSGAGTFGANPGTIYLGAEAGGTSFGQGVYLSNIVIDGSGNGAFQGLFEGDSIGAGYTAAAPASATFAADYPGILVKNYSVGGTQSAQILARLPTELAGLGHVGSVFTDMGTNDILLGDAGALTTATCEGNFLQYWATVVDAGAAAYPLLMPPLGPLPNPTQQAQHEALDLWMANVAADAGWRVLDLEALLGQSVADGGSKSTWGFGCNQGDLIHPSTTGQVKIGAAEANLFADGGGGTANTGTCP